MASAWKWDILPGIAWVAGRRFKIFLLKYYYSWDGITWTQTSTWLMNEWEKHQLRKVLKKVTHEYNPGTSLQCFKKDKKGPQSSNLCSNHGEKIILIA